jgi:hypothetical protein
MTPLSPLSATEVAAALQLDPPLPVRFWTLVYQVRDWPPGTFVYPSAPDPHGDITFWWTCRGPRAGPIGMMMTEPEALGNVSVFEHAAALHAVRTVERHGRPVDEGLVTEVAEPVYVGGGVAMARHPLRSLAWMRLDNLFPVPPTK